MRGQWKEKRRLWAACIFAAFLAFSATLRAPITAIPPIVQEIQSALGLSAAAAGLLTSIPVFCFGVFTPLASACLRRSGLNMGICLCLSTMVLGALMRSAGYSWSLFAGTALIGVGMTVGNLAIPMVIGRDYRHRAGLVTALYATTLDVLITASTAFSFPLVAYIGWKGAAGVWGVIPALIALVLCALVYPVRSFGIRASLARRAGMHDALDDDSLVVGAPAAQGSVMHWPIAWVMALAFALHNFCYYVFAAWLPAILSDMMGLGRSEAGYAASIFHIVGMCAPLAMMGVQKLLSGATSTVLGIVCVSWVLMPVGMLVLPGLWPLWCAAGGLGQGAFFSILFTLVIERTSSVDETRSLSALVQTIGYAAAAVGPTLIGLIYDRTASWTLPFAVVAACTAGLLVCSHVIAHSRTTPADYAQAPTESGDSRP